MIGHLVACTWLDAHGDAKAEFGMEEIALSTSYRFTTYGILVRDDRGKVMVDALVAIAAEQGQDGRFRGVTFIPAAMVTEVRDLGSPKRRVRPRSPSGAKQVRAKLALPSAASHLNPASPDAGSGG